MPPRAPRARDVYAVRVGDSVRERFGDARARAAPPLTVFRYDFSASNADATARARVKISPCGAVDVAFDAVRDGDAREGDRRAVRYRGMRRARRARGREDAEEGEAPRASDDGASEDVGIDCALVFDEASGTFTLEVVDGEIGNLRIAREDAEDVGAGELTTKTEERRAAAAAAAASAAASAAARDAREGADANGERDVVDALPSSKKKPRKT